MSDKPQTADELLDEMSLKLFGIRYSALNDEQAFATLDAARAENDKRQREKREK
jgi:hypothetical protein